MDTKFASRDPIYSMLKSIGSLTNCFFIDCNTTSGGKSTTHVNLSNLLKTQ